LGFETTHVNEILDKWKTSDKDICKHADTNNLVLITKDADFRNSFFVNHTPKKLVKINLGNISNQELIDIISKHISKISSLDINAYFLIEIGAEIVTFIVDEEKPKDR